VELHAFDRVSQLEPGKGRAMPKWPKISPKLIGQWAAACAVAALVAAALALIISQYTALSAASVREIALNVASLFVAYLLLAGIGRKKQKDKS